MLTFVFLLHHSGTGCLAILCRRKKTSETFVNVDAEGQILVKCSHCVIGGQADTVFLRITYV